VDLKYALVPVAVVVLFLGATLGLACFNVPQKGAETANDSFSFDAHLKESGIANAGVKNAAYATVGLDGSGVRNSNFTFLWLADRVPRDVYLLDYPMADAADQSFKSSLSASLRAYGFALKDASESDVALMRKSVLLVSTGAIPEFLTENNSLEEFLERGNVLVYSGMPFNYALQADGSLSVSNYSGVAAYTENGIESKLNGSVVNQLADGTSVGFGGGYLYIMPNATDAQELARTVVYGEWQKLLGMESYETEPAGNFGLNKTFFASASTETSGYGRIIYALNTTNGTMYGVLDTPEMEKLRGSIRGDTPILPGVGFNYSVYLNETYNQTTTLELGLVAIKDGNVVDRLPVAAANVRDVWVSPPSSYRNNLTPGDYLLELKDGNDAIHAKAQLHVENLSARLASVSGFRYAFLVLLDGKPYSGGVSARLDGSEMTKEYTVGGDGMMTVPADVPSGAHVFHLLAENQEMDVPYDNTQTSLAGFYLQYGVPALLVGGTLYVLLKRPARKKYRVNMPAFSDPEPQTIPMNEKEFMGIFDDVQKCHGWRNAPLTPAEIRSGLRSKFARRGKGIAITDSNLSNVMEELERKNLVRSWNEYYAPVQWLGKEDIRFHAARRMVRDRLIEKGLAFKDRGDFFEVAGGAGKTFYHTYNGNRVAGRVLRNAKAGRNVLVFPDAEALSQFALSLNECDEEKIRMGMEIVHNRVALTTVEGVMLA
jgi:hypothetical protein